MKDKRQDIEAELSEITPFLTQLKKDNTPIEAFEVPTDYFDKMANTIFQNTIFQNKKTVVPTIIDTPKESFWKNIQYYLQGLLRPTLVVATTCVVVLTVAGVYLMNNQTNDLALDLTASEIETYLIDNIESFDVEQLTSMVSGENIVSPPTLIPEIETKDLENYIEENYIEDFELEELM